MSIANHGRIASILVSSFRMTNPIFLSRVHYSGDYDNSPLCEFKPVCRDKPNGNYVDQYRPNCQFHYTCLESRTFNYTACEYGHRFSVQHQKCLPAKQVKCSSRRISSHEQFFLNLVILIFPFLLDL